MNKPYITSGTDIAPMLGRMRLFKRVSNMLVKPTPDNVSIVGPKLYGKTVFLNHLSGRFASDPKHYLNSVFIDLRHGTPQTDAEFLIKMAGSIREALQSYDSELAQILNETDPEIIADMLQLAFDALAENKKRLLVVFDGFDFLPIGTGISPNLLDQLRSLVEKPSLSFIIGSRARLRNLCKTEESRTSDFWRIFAEPVLLGPFEDQDWDDLWKPFAEKTISVEQGAKTELRRQTGDIPVLVTGILQNLHATAVKNSKLTNVDVAECCKTFHADLPDAIRDLWDDCSIELQGLMAEAPSGELKKENVPQPLRTEAESRGLTRTEKGFLRVQCRIIAEHAKNMACGVQDMNRLFGSKENFDQNIRRLLELRLGHYVGCDERLQRYVGYAIRDLADEPRRVLDSARGIIEVTLEVCLSAEGVKTGEALPKIWKEDWERTNIKGVPNNFDPIPNDRGQLCKFLRHITGREVRYIRVAKKVSRHTSLLIDQVSSIGNFINHREWEAPSYGLACSMCFLAIELMASIKRDLSKE
jgi:hypothetical protein